MGLVQKGIAKLASDGPVEFLRSANRYLQSRLKRNRTYLRAKYRIHHRIDGHKAAPDPFKILYVSPREIERYSSEFGKWESVGKVQGGNWDQKATPVDQMKKYQAVEQHFCNGGSWEDTGIIDHLLKRLSEEGRNSIDGCRNREELKDRYDRIDELYDELRSRGYKEKKHSPTNYIAVHISRDGEFIFAGSGCHRLSISKILDLNEIPVWVRARHKEWQNVREQAHIANTEEDVEEPLKKYLDHPDLKSLV